jgi:hypothetical protein
MPAQMSKQIAQADKPHQFKYHMKERKKLRNSNPKQQFCSSRYNSHTTRIHSAENGTKREANNYSETKNQCLGENCTLFYFF